jgi:hypothetical protein
VSVPSGVGSTEKSAQKGEAYPHSIFGCFESKVGAHSTRAWAISEYSTHTHFFFYSFLRSRLKRILSETAFSLAFIATGPYT